MHTDDRRQLILAAAERLLRHYGAAKTTMAEIAREADVGVGSVYLEFPSKEAIIEDLVRAKHQRMLGAMRGAMGAGTTFESRLRGMIDSKVRVMFAMVDEGLHAPELIHCDRPAAQTAERCFLDEELHLLATLVQEAVDAGEFEASDPQRAANAILRAYASFWPPAVFHQPRETAVAALDAVHDVVFRGLLARRPHPHTRRR